MQTESTLKLTGRIHVGATAHDVFEKLAERLIAVATRSVVDRGSFHLALSGGSTPAPFYTSLAIDPRYRVLPWDATHLWIVDERRVPNDDDRYNFKMIRETLADHIPTPREQIHAVDTAVDDPAGAYESEMREVFGPTDTPRLDMVLLGMGDDGHTASLFPGSPALDINDQLIANNDGPTVTPPPRVTMTFPLINAARNVGVLVIGGKKFPTLKTLDAQLRNAGPDIRSLPISGIDPASHQGGELDWWIDAAAGGLS